MQIEEKTGALFGSLWNKLTDQQYRESVELFAKRFEANGFDLTWFKGRRCLDAGTGSGRYAVAMAMCGAAEVVGCDVSDTGLATARERAAGLPITFQKASVLALPFPDASFDFVCCAGVLHHTTDLQKGLDEVVRVLKPGGKLFLLLYGAGGLRWSAILSLRPICARLGYDYVDRAIQAAGLPANNRKHFLDDLFVPVLDQVDGAELDGWLKARGMTAIESWKRGRQYDHEGSPQSQAADIEKLVRIFEAADFGSPGEKVLASIAADTARSFLGAAKATISSGLSADQVEDIVIGQGLHRIMAVKG